MKPLRRHDLAPRIELLPLLDVVFLLLTFFIFTWFRMVQANVLPVDLLPMATGGQASGDGFYAVTIDADGQYFFNREQVTADQLDIHLAALADDPHQPMLYVALELEGSTDRAPVMLDLWQRMHNAGIRRVTWVGPPAPPASPAPPGER